MTSWIPTGGSPEGIQCYGQGDRPPSGEGALMIILYIDFGEININIF